MGKRKAGVYLFLLLILQNTAWSQLKTNSFYSQYGIGNLLETSSARPFGMGGAGVAMPHPGYINSLNPALLRYHNLTIYEFTIMGQQKNVSNGENGKNFLSGNIDYLNLTFPIDKDFWTFSAAVQPFSNVSFRAESQLSLKNNPQTTVEPKEIFDLNGSLTEIYISNGFKLYESLSLGLRTSYIFGTINSEKITSLGLGDPDRSFIKEKTRYKFIRFKPGLNYRKKIKKELFANIGGTYSFGTNLIDSKTSKFSGLRDGTLTPQGNASFVDYYKDTLKNNENFSAQLPQTYKFGISLDKINKWALGLDFSYGNWENFNGKDENSKLTDNYGINFGGEYVPDVDALQGYFNKVVYRAGMFYENTPKIVNNEQIKNFGINFGASFPMRIKEKIHPKESATLNVNIGLGQMGSLKNKLLRERYIKLFIGININDKWFQQPKYN